MQLLPDDNLEGVDMGQASLTLIFDKPVAAGTGSFRIYRSFDNQLRQEIDVTDSTKVSQLLL